jgi:hypothetical protein
MINIFYTYQSNGPGKVVKNLKKGLDIIGHKYSENNNVLNNNDFNIFLQIHPLIKTSAIKNSIIGPNVCVLPIDNAIVLNQEYKKIIVPSEWIKNKYKKWISEDKIEIWSVGIDTDFFSDKSKKDKEFDCLIYFKRRDESELKFIECFLKEKKQTYKIIRYGNYNELDFIDIISKSKYGIVIDSCESQGIAIQEMMSCNLPLLVWDVKFWNDRGEENKFEATSIPLFNEQCGLFFYEKEELKNKWNDFMLNLNFYNPRNYILENLTLEKKTKELIKIFNK